MATFCEARQDMATGHDPPRYVYNRNNGDGQQHTEDHRLKSLWHMDSQARQRQRPGEMYLAPTYGNGGEQGQPLDRLSSSLSLRAEGRVEDKPAHRAY